MRKRVALALLLTLLGCKREPEKKPAPPATPGPVEFARSEALKWSVPEGWKEEPVTSPMRRAQYRLARAEGDAEDAECVVHYFGPGQGGMVEANVSRWLGQFAQPDGRPTAPGSGGAKVAKLTANGLAVTVVEAQGTYASGSMMPGAAPSAPKPGWALLGAIAETKSGPWFFKLTGPQKSTQKWRGSFDALVASLQSQPTP